MVVDLWLRVCCLILICKNPRPKLNMIFLKKDFESALLEAKGWMFVNFEQLYPLSGGPKPEWKFGTPHPHTAGTSTFSARRAFALKITQMCFLVSLSSDTSLFGVCKVGQWSSENFSTS